MPSRQKTEPAMSPELDAIAAAAADRLRAQCGDDAATVDEHARRVADAAAPLSAPAPGSARSPPPSGWGRTAPATSWAPTSSVVSSAPPSAKREADSEYEHAITRAGRLGLSHREIAAAAHVSHGTIRAILARATPGANNGRADEPQPVDGEPGELAA